MDKVHLVIALLSFISFAQEERPDPTELRSPEPSIPPYGGGNCSNTPIVIDLNGDGFLFSGPDHPVRFDLNATGAPVTLQWVAGEDDAFLVRDLNGNGLVDNGGELFGSEARLCMADNTRPPNGFVALAQFDHPTLGGDYNGQLDDRDKIWSELSLWLDRDRDGISTSDEMLTLDTYGITALEIIPRASFEADHFNNQLKWWAWTFQGDIRHRLPMVEVNFRQIKQSKKPLPVREPHYLEDGKTFFYNQKWHLAPPPSELEEEAYVHISEYFMRRSEILEDKLAAFKEMGRAGKKLPQGMSYEQNGLDVSGFFHPELVRFGDTFNDFATEFAKDPRQDYKGLYQRGFPLEEMPHLLELVSGENSFVVFEKTRAEDLQRFQQKQLPFGERSILTNEWMTLIFDQLSPRAQRVLISYIRDQLINNVVVGYLTINK